MVTATRVDKDGKKRNLKNLSPGNCSFPFKYRRRDVYKCQVRKDGEWCATSVDSDKKMKTWAYCNTKKNCLPEKILNPATGRCVSKNGNIGKKLLQKNKQQKKNTKPKKTTQTKKNKIKKNMKPDKNKLLNAKRNDILENIRVEGKNLDCKIFSNKSSKLKFLGSGVANRVYLSCVNPECKRRVAVRLMTISGDLNYDSKHPNKLELRAYDKFNQLLVDNITQHVPYKITNFQCNVNDLLRTNIKNNAIDFRHRFIMSEIKNNVDILITELCKFGHARGFLNKNMYKMSDRDLRIFIFQFMTGLVTLQYHIPGFKHNDIHSENILVGNYNLKEKKSVGTNKYIKYVLFGQDFYVPLREYCVKIYDFDTMNGRDFKNSKLLDSIYKQVGVTSKPNPVFDYHLGMNSLFNVNDFNTSKHTETLNFFSAQIPEKYRGGQNMYLSYARLTNYKTNYNLDNTNLVPHEIKTPCDVLLNNSYFDDFRQKPDNCIIVDIIDTKIPAYDKIKHLKYMFK
jgi:hypothetical protein